MFDTALQAQAIVSRRKNGLITITKYAGYPNSTEDQFRIGFMPISVGSDPTRATDDVHWMTLVRSELEEFIEALRFVSEPAEDNE